MQTIMQNTVIELTFHSEKSFTQMPDNLDFTVCLKGADGERTIP